MTRTYATQDLCPVARTLDIIGERWTLLVLRDLTLGVTKYNDLLQSLAGISSNLLSERLKRLEEAGIVQRSFYSDHPPRAEYVLTEKGLGLIPVLRAIGEWGYKHELDDKARQHPEVVKRMKAVDAKVPRSG